MNWVPSLDDRRHHEDPAQHADAHRHDQGVEQAGPIASGDAALGQPQHRQRDHAHAAQVEDVSHARERLDAETRSSRTQVQSPAVVSTRPAAKASQGRASAGRWIDAGQISDHRRHRGHLVGELLRVLGHQEVARARAIPVRRNQSQACARTPGALPEARHPFSRYGPGGASGHCPYVPNRAAIGPRDCAHFRRTERHGISGSNGMPHQGRPAIGTDVDRADHEPARQGCVESTPW